MVQIALRNDSSYTHPNGKFIAEEFSEIIDEVEDEDGVLIVAENEQLFIYPSRAIIRVVLRKDDLVTADELGGL